LRPHVPLSQLPIDHQFCPSDGQKLQPGRRLSTPDLVADNETPNPKVFAFNSALNTEFDPSMPHR
jgi:hypothetical protein